MIYSFDPIKTTSSKILILGTMPSVKSLGDNQYYAHPKNAFWKIMFALWNEPLKEDYDARINFLKQKDIALWDILKKCNREGSMDSNIKNPVPNDIAGLLKRCKKIKHIFFNGQKSRYYFDKILLDEISNKIKLTTLPSTSPARAIKFEEKLEQWNYIKIALGCVEK